MNQVKLIIFCLAFIVLTACGGKSDSDSTDAEFLKVSAELIQALPQVDESLFSQSPEGIWRIASHSVLNASSEIYNEGRQKKSGFLDIDSEYSSQLLVIIHKDYTAENAYIVYKCDGYRGVKSWVLNENMLSYKIINDSFEETGNLVLTANLSLVGQDNYQYNDENSDQQTNTTYAGVKISNSISFKEAQDLNIDLQINQKDSSYQLSDYVINPGCFSISQAEGELREYELTPDDGKAYKQSSSSVVIEMMDGNSISVNEGAIVIDSETSTDLSSYYSDVDWQYFQLFYCSEDWGLPDEECLKSFEMTTSTETYGMSASSKGEGLTGEAFEVSFSYSQE